jgi:hypothetical protein
MKQYMAFGELGLEQPSRIKMSKKSPKRLRFSVAEPLSRLVRYCETYCVVECCGIDAFEIDSARIDLWITEVGIVIAETALNQLDQLIEETTQFKGKVESSDCFNQVWSWSWQARRYLESWRRELVAAFRQQFGVETFAKTILAWKHGTILALAETIHRKKSTILLPVLADALIDAGCSHESLVSHCRLPHEEHGSCCIAEILLLIAEEFSTRS